METAIFILEIIVSVTASLFLHDFIKMKLRPKQQEKQVIRRAVVKNYGKFADPIGEYEQFKDVKTNLYTTYEPKKKTRRGGVSE